MIKISLLGIMNICFLIVRAIMYNHDLAPSFDIGSKVRTFQNISAGPQKRKKKKKISDGKTKPKVRKQYMYYDHIYFSVHLYHRNYWVLQSLNLPKNRASL